MGQQSTPSDSSLASGCSRAEAKVTHHSSCSGWCTRLASPAQWGDGEFAVSWGYESYFLGQDPAECLTYPEIFFKSYSNTCPSGLPVFFSCKRPTTIFETWRPNSQCLRVCTVFCIPAASVYPSEASRKRYSVSQLQLEAESYVFSMKGTPCAGLPWNVPTILKGSGHLLYLRNYRLKVKIFSVLN